MKPRVITAEDRKMSLPLWAVPFVLAGAFLLSVVFNNFGKFSLARPTLSAVAVISITVAMRWTLKGHVWFWITMAVLTAIRVPLILFIPWTAQWTPAPLVIPIGIADSYAMLWVISIVARRKGVPISHIGTRV